MLLILVSRMEEEKFMVQGQWSLAHVDARERFSQGFGTWNCQNIGTRSQHTVF